MATKVRHTGRRGRPALDLDFKDVLLAVLRHRGILPAVGGLGCSQAYIHAQLKNHNLTLRDVLEHPATARFREGLR